MPLDVQPDHLQIVKDILHQHIPDRRIEAFGSRVTGTARIYSDLDLCIMGDEPVSVLTLGSLRDEFSLSNLPYKVDVIDWTAIAPNFRKIILENCFEIQQPKRA